MESVNVCPIKEESIKMHYIYNYINDLEII